MERTQPLVDHAQGALLHTLDPAYAGRVYYCHDGHRHYMRDALWATEQGFRWPEDLQRVPVEVLGAFRTGRPVARQWPASAWADPPVRDIFDMREIAVSQLRGNGIEIGAGANPLPIPLRCSVRYVDAYDKTQLTGHLYPGQLFVELVAPDVVASFEDLSPIPESSVDFLASCHVIEHTRDPVGAIIGAWRRLRPGGSIVLVVPEHSRTFDRFRPLTTLDHLVKDFLEPDLTRQRDQAHFREFYALALPAAPGEYATLWREKWAEAFPIHYHTWTHASFGSMVRWMEEHGVLPGLAEVWSQAPLPDRTACIEFWYVLTKEI
jgi:SAM-dependent methyltransferase